MRKLINTLKYSSLKAKLILILTILAGLAGASLVVASILTHMTVLFFGAVMCGFGALALAQTFVIHTWLCRSRLQMKSRRIFRI